MNTKLAVMACTTVLASSFMLFAGLHDVADANRRQAAARCIDSWHAWVRGTHSRIKYPDIEYCMLLSDVEPPEGMADRMRESDQWLREQEKRELHGRHEHELFFRSIHVDKKFTISARRFPYPVSHCAIKTNDASPPGAETLLPVL